MSGMKYQDIADKYDVSINTVKSWKKRYSWERKKGAHKIEKGCTQNGANNISWIDIENEYVTDVRKKPCTLGELAEKYNLSYEYLRRYAAEREWKEKRKKYITNTSQKIIDKSSEQDADRILRLLRIADTASEKAEKALEQLETYMVKNKTKTRTIEYKDKNAVGKPTKEIVEEKEDIVSVSGMIDRKGLLYITNTLKNLKDIYNVDNDTNENKGKQDKNNIENILEQINPVDKEDIYE